MKKKTAPKPKARAKLTKTPRVKKAIESLRSTIQRNAEPPERPLGLGNGITINGSKTVIKTTDQVDYEAARAADAVTKPPKAANRHDAAKKAWVTIRANKARQAQELADLRAQLAEAVAQ